jgi:hypothetical protein
LLTIFLADHLERELHLGNVNLFLLILATACYLNLAKRPWFAGLLYALVILFKPHFLILLPYFIWKGQWRVIASSVLGVVIGFILPSLFVGFAQNMELHAQWLEAMKAHNISLTESANTVYGIVNHFLLEVDKAMLLVVSLLLAVGLLFLWFMNYNKNTAGKGYVWFIEFFILLALIPNLTHTDTEHFMWSLPLVGFNLFFLVHTQIKAKWLAVVVMFLAFIPYTLNSPDIVGSKIRFLFDEGGLLGIANLMIILLSVFIHLQLSKEDTHHLRVKV